jgi:hypothetical protein
LYQRRVGIVEKLSEQIKKTLIQQAKHQPTWGQYLPKCFVPLELEIAALVRKEVALITMNDMKKINSQQAIRHFRIGLVSSINKYLIIDDQM